jgi:siderophore synthetase component
MRIDKIHHQVDSNHQAKTVAAFFAEKQTHQLGLFVNHSLSRLSTRTLFLFYHNVK